MKAVGYVLGISASVSMIIILLITSFEAVLYTDFRVYEKEYEKQDVLSDLDMEMEDVMYVTREMMAYLRGNREELRAVVFVEGKEQDFFNEQDRLHMADVQSLFLGGVYLRRGALFVLAVALTLLATRVKDWKRVLARSCQGVLAAAGLLLIVLGIAAGRNFTDVFVKFHEIFFTNDLWLFDPAQDYMIRMLPEGLFFDMALRIGVLFFAGIIILLVLSVLFGRNKNYT